MKQFEIISVMKLFCLWCLFANQMFSLTQWKMVFRRLVVATILALCHCGLWHQAAGLTVQVCIQI